MAKDVDLSSKEWRDIIFEGKNKDFGAYQLRKGSVSRHNRAMIVIVIVIAILFALAFLVNTVIKSAEARPEDAIEQAMAEMITEEVEEEPEEEEPQRIEEQKPEVIKEELLNTTKAAEILIVQDDEVEEELNCIVDLGGTVVDVFVYHKVYGVVRADMNIRSRMEVRRYLKTLEGGKSSLLKNVTSGYHYHTVRAESAEALDLIQEELQKRGFLAKLQDYEPVDFWGAGNG